MKARHGTRISRIFADGRQIDEALRAAAREAIRTHQKRNAPVVVWRDGRTALVSARELTTTAKRKVLSAQATSRATKPVARTTRSLKARAPNNVP